MSRESAYQELIDAVIAGEQLEIANDGLFNVNSFRSAFYRYCDTEFGKMLLGDRNLSVKFNAKSETYLILAANPKKLNFNIVSRKKEND